MQFFHKRILDLDLFEKLSNSATFEDITNGRKGGVLVDCQNDFIPIVRTTTKYNAPACKFLPIHHDIIEKIKEKFFDIPNIEFNNALIEIYDGNYRKMGLHTDQSLDLKEDSFICLFSCYKDVCTENDTRTLYVQNKTTKECSKIPLQNSSAVLFSTTTNHQHLHKIVLDSDKPSSNQWLGITFRLSKTFVNFINGVAHIVKPLKVANKSEKGEFYRNKGKENREIQHTWPEIDYTISKSDLMRPI